MFYQTHNYLIDIPLGAPCTTPSYEKGVCISIRQCDSLYTMMKDHGRDPFIIKFLRDSKCGGTGRDPHVCCPSSAEESRSLHPEPSSTTTKPLSKVSLP